MQKKLQREQEELARKQKEDLERERKPADNTCAQDQVAEAWRKAQQEAAPRRGRHSGRHGSPPRGASIGGGGAAAPPPTHTAVAALRESRSRSRSPGREGGAGAHGFSDRGMVGVQGGQARVGFVDPLDPRQERGFDRGQSGHGGLQWGSGAAQRPLSSIRSGPGVDQLGSDSVSQKLEQVWSPVHSRLWSWNWRCRAHTAGAIPPVRHCCMIQ